MISDATEGLGNFFDSVWRDTSGWVYLATIQGGDNQTFKQYLLEWPKKRSSIVQHVLKQSASGCDVYFSPALYREQSRPTRENVLGSWTNWADFDNKAAPEDWSSFAKEAGVPAPTLRVRSSVEGNEHVYWELEGFQTNIAQLEDANRALAYKLRADTSGWDADQLLRPPYTANYGYKKPNEFKPWYDGQPVQVTVVEHRDDKVSASSFLA